MLRSENGKAVIRVGLLALAVVFLVVGAYRGEVSTVLSKAIRLCMECVGIG